MKKLFLMAAALSAAISLSACSDDDDDNANVSKGIISQIDIEYDSDNITTLKFDYDDQGRVSRIVNYKNDDYTGTELFTHSGNKLEINTILKGYSKDILHEATLNNQGYIISRTNTEMESEAVSYEYDSKGYIQTINNSDSRSNYSWKNGDLISITNEITNEYIEDIDEYTYTYTYTYTSYLTRQNLNINYFTSIGIPPTWDLIGLFGKKSRHLVKSCSQTSVGYNDVIVEYEYEYEYEFDKKGYLNTIIITGIYDNGLYEETYTYKVFLHYQ